MSGEVNSRVGSEANILTIRSGSDPATRPALTVTVVSVLSCRATGAVVGTMEELLDAALAMEAE